MKRVVAAVDRLLVVLLGLALVLSGAFALAWYFDAPFAVELLSRFDRDIFGNFPMQNWWEPALAATAVLSTLVAIALLIGNLSPRRTGTLQISSEDSLAVRVDLGALARGVAAELATFPGVDSARGRAIDDRGSATLAVTVETTPHIDIDAFTRHAERKADFIAEATEGGPVALRIQVHAATPGVEQAERPSSRSGPYNRGSTGSDSIASTANTA